MPKETFWNSDVAVEGDGVSEPVLTVTWGAETPGVYLNGVQFDQSGIDRLVNSLRRASGRDRTVTVTLHANTDEYVASMERAKTVTRELADELRAAGVAKGDMGEAIITVAKLATGE